MKRDKIAPRCGYGWMLILVEGSLNRSAFTPCPRVTTGNNGYRIRWREMAEGKHRGSVTLIGAGRGPTAWQLSSPWKFLKSNAAKLSAGSVRSPGLGFDRSVHARNVAIGRHYYRSLGREIYRVHASRAFHEHMSCYLRARHYSLPDLLYFTLRG